MNIIIKRIRYVSRVSHRLVLLLLLRDMSRQARQQEEKKQTHTHAHRYADTARGFWYFLAGYHWWEVRSVFTVNSYYDLMSLTVSLDNVQRRADTGVEIPGKTWTCVVSYCLLTISETFLAKIKTFQPRSSGSHYYSQELTDKQKQNTSTCCSLL